MRKQPFKLIIELFLKLQHKNECDNYKHNIWNISMKDFEYTPAQVTVAPGWLVVKIESDSSVDVYTYYY